MSRHSLRIAVFALIHKDNKILMLRRHNTGHEDGYLGIPAGHLEADENMYEAALREAKEEVGITATSCSLVHTMHVLCPDQAFDYIYLFFKIDDFTGAPVNMEPEKCSEILWNSPDQNQHEMSGYIGQALECFLHKTPGSTYTFRNAKTG